MNARFSVPNGVATDSDSSDDIALIRKANKNSYHALRHRCWEKCKYCHKVLINRYAVLKHNLNHISVPLEKQPIYPCKQCLTYYTSPETLASHISKKHKDVLTKSCISVKLKLVDDLKDNFKKEVLEDGFEDNVSDMEDLDDEVKITEEEEECIIPDIIHFEDRMLDKEEVISDDEEFNNLQEKFKNGFEDRMSDSDNFEEVSEFEEVENDFEDTSQVESKVDNPEISKILKSMIEKQVVIKCNDDLKEVLKINNKQTNLNNSIVMEELKPILNGIKEKCLKVNPKLRGSEEKNILRSIVEKEPVIRCENDLTICIGNKNIENKSYYTKDTKIHKKDNENMFYDTSTMEIAQANSSKVVIKQELSSRNDYKIDIEEHDILQSIVENQAVVKCENDLQEIFMKHDKTSISNENLKLIQSNNSNMQFGGRNNGNMQLVGRNNSNMQLVGSNNSNMQLVGSNNSNMQLNITKNMRDTKNEEIDNLTVKEELLSPKSLQNEHSISEEDKEPIRHRLLFEEDLEDTLFTHLSTGYNDIETLCPQIDIDFDDTLPLLVEVNVPENIGINKVVQNETTDLLLYSKAIHYDTLILPELCECKWCGQEFPNRFDLLQHEPVHMSRKNWRAPFCVFCERYIGGNFKSLRIHKEKCHPELLIDRNYKTNECNLCGLKYYNYRRHVKNFHEIYRCEKCEKGFQTLKMKNVHECGKFLTTNLNDGPVKLFSIAEDDLSNTQNDLTNEIDEIKHHVMYLCQMCYSFMKIYMQNRSNYEVVGRRSKIGEQQTCGKCNTKVFETVVISRKVYKHKNFDAKDLPVTKDSNLFTEVQNVRRNVIFNEMRAVQTHRKPVVTNEMRLKNIRNRLKMLKQIRKY